MNRHDWRVLFAVGLINGLDLATLRVIVGALAAAIGVALLL